MSSDKIKVVLVDDHRLVRDAIAIMLQQIDDIQIVGAFSNAEELLAKVADLNPDVIIMDIMMTGMTGIEATHWVKDRFPRIKVLILSMEVKREFVSAGIQSGIDGYLPKDVEKKVLIDAVRTLNRGEKYFNEAITTLVFEDFYNKERTNKQVKQHLGSNELSKLTKRELEILSLIAAGKSAKQVADELFISTKTVDTHKAHILDKLGLSNTAELVKYAIKNELIAL
jgi:DNA-binding NarL/FixJ family response regulator